MVAGADGTALVLGLSAQVVISGLDAIDRIVINTLAGDDMVEASALEAIASC